MPVILLLLVIGGLIAYAAWMSHQRAVAVWREVAQELGFQFASAGRMSRPVIEGTLGGIPVRTDTYVQRSGNSSTTYTRYRARYPALGVDLRLSREGAFSAITKFFGAQDVDTGDQLFDEAFTVKTSDPARLRSILTPSVRAGLLRLLASYSSARIGDDQIQVVRRGFERKADVLKSTIQRIAATARLLESPDAGISDDMVVDREQGLLTDVAARVRDLIETQPGDVDQRIFEVETLAASGDEEAAARRLEELERLAPADPDVAGWKKALETPVARPTDGGEVNVAELAKELFGGSDLSFETSSKFNGRYAGRPVRWEGRIKQTKGSKTTITVASVDHDLYGNTEIDVVVENPSGRTPQLGETVTVAGTLETIDPLMRNLYVGDASLS